MRTPDNRVGEVALETDPAQMAGDARLIFIGRVRSPWTSRETCPKNMRAAREAGGSSALEIGRPWRQGLVGLEPGMPLIVLCWMDRARRDLIVQAPRHRETTSGVFAIRSPVRPNPLSVSVVRCLAIDHANGRLVIDAIDALDGTPVVDLKPWLAGVDVHPAD